MQAAARYINPPDIPPLGPLNLYQFVGCLPDHVCLFNFCHERLPFCPKLWSEVCAHQFGLAAKPRGMFESHHVTQFVHHDYPQVHLPGFPTQAPSVPGSCWIDAYGVV